MEPLEIPVDCDDLKDFKITVKLNGVDLKIIHNALVVLSESETPDCSTCTGIQSALEDKIQNLLADAINEVEIL